MQNSRSTNDTWLLLLAYASSGLAGLIYEVSWTRLLTLRMGQGTAAASTVVAAFMGGLAAGSALGGRLAARLTPRQALYAYIWLECVVVVIALTVPYQLAALTPVLAWSYRDGAQGPLFPMTRLAACLTIMLIPAAALGATFPLIVRWFVNRSEHAGSAAGNMYAVNSAGAAIGTIAAGFALIPLLGISGTTYVGVAASALAVLGAMILAQRSHEQGPQPEQSPPRKQGKPEKLPTFWVAGIALGISGFAALLFEIVLTRVLALLIGPTTYAFSATLAALIGGMAFGSAIGAWSARRLRRPALCLALVLAATSIATSLASRLAGDYIPRLVAEHVARSPAGPNQFLTGPLFLAAALVVPAAIGFGAAFPLALEMIGATGSSIARRFGLVYAINTLAAVTGALIAGFVAIPLLGLHHTLQMVSSLLVLDAIIVLPWAERSRKARVAVLVPVAAATLMVVSSPAWNRELLASGAYKYAPNVQKDLDLESALTAGTLLYYRDGAAATVSVKELTGHRSLAIDGKVDASNSGDMLTQKALAHLPLLLHEKPRDVVIIGLGSGVTLASALVHPIARADVAEISPEVVEASRYFAADNRNALDDPRTRLLQGDGRSHLLLSSRKYDVIISEPSNPWMAGVAALFTREFFATARDRLSAGGIFCQWAHTYDISDGDLRSIVATFLSVFPDATLWMIGESDVLLVASAGPLDAQLANVEDGWRRPGVAADLRSVSALEPFAFWSLFAAGPAELKRYAAGAPLQTDDLLALEFSGPRVFSNRSSVDNASNLRGLLDPGGGPSIVRDAMAAARPAQWRDRAAMMFEAYDFAGAYRDYERALKLDPTDAMTLEGLARAAVASDRESRTIELLRTLVKAHPDVPAMWVALSKLYAATGSPEQAIAAARVASTIQPAQAFALEQLASLFADLGDAAQLEPVVGQLQQLQPQRAGSQYYAAVSLFLRRQFTDALRLARVAIRLDSQYAAAYNLVGAIHANLGQQQEARDAFQVALRLNTQDGATYTNLGLLELAAGNYATAAGHLAAALSLDPASSAAREGLAYALAGTPR